MRHPHKGDAHYAHKLMATYQNMSEYALSCNTNRYQDDVLYTFVRYSAVNFKPNSFGTEFGCSKISQRSSNVNFVSKVIKGPTLLSDSEALITWLLKIVVTYQRICKGAAICSFQEAIQF